MIYNPEGQTGLPVLTIYGRDQLRYVYDCLFFNDEYGPEDAATKRLAHHIDKAEDRYFNLVGKRAMEIYWVVQSDCQRDNPAGEIAEASIGAAQDYIYADSYHGPQLTAA